MAPKYENLSVLIIDDDRLMIRLIEHILRGMGFEDIHASQDPETGLALILEGDNIGDGFDLIICDWMMPNMTGIEILKRLRAKRLETPFIMLTANVSEAAVREASQSHVSAYLAKPFTPEQVKRKVISALRHA